MKIILVCMLIFFVGGNISLLYFFGKGLMRWEREDREWKESAAYRDYLARRIANAQAAEWEAEMRWGRGVRN